MRLRRVLAAAALLLALSACRDLDDQRVPAFPVYVEFTTSADWDDYGVPGAGSYRNFILKQRIPPSFPYTSMSRTGYGGLLLVGDFFGMPVCYDLACPVEREPDVRVLVDAEALNAYCPQCGSIYSIFENYGKPLGGPAAQRDYGLRTYHVGSGGTRAYMLISN